MPLDDLEAPTFGARWRGTVPRARHGSLPLACATRRLEGVENLRAAVALFVCIRCGRAKGWPARWDWSIPRCRFI